MSNGAESSVPGHRGMGNLGLISIFLIIGSSNPIAIKAAMNLGWPPFFLGLLRMAFIGMFFMVWGLLAGESLAGPNATARRHTLVAAACKGAGVLLFYLALSIIPASRAVILSTISPAVNLVLIHLMLEHERVERRHVLGIAISFIGIVILLLLRYGELGVPGGESAAVLFGDVAMIASVIFHQAMVVFEKKALTNGANPRQLIISTNLISVLVFGLLIMTGNERASDIPTTPAAMGAFVYLITVVGVILFYYRRWMVSVLDVSYINSFSHAGKAISVLYAAVFLGERISASSLACFGMVLIGTAIASGREKTKIQDQIVAE